MFTQLRFTTIYLEDRQYPLSRLAASLPLVGYGICSALFMTDVGSQDTGRNFPARTVVSEQAKIRPPTRLVAYSILKEMLSMIFHRMVDTAGELHS